jgi:syntaxin-binding protein 1
MPVAYIVVVPSRLSFVSCSGKTLKATGNIDEETEYNSRYVPPLQTILEDLVNNRLSLEEYPSLMPMPEMMSMGSSGTAASARKRDTASARKSGSTTSRWQKATPKENTKPGLFTGGRAIVFYVGGICYSELRVARTVMDRENKEIVVGSTHFTKPKDFLRDMDKLSDSS